MALSRRAMSSLGAILLLGQGPAVHAEAATPTVRQLVETTDIGSVSISPDGRQLVFRTERADVERNSYVLDWYSVDLSSGVARRIGGGGDPIYGDPGIVQSEPPIWTSDGRAIVFRALVDGAIGVWRAGLSGASMAPLIVRDADVETLALSPDGQTLVYKVGPSREQIESAERQEYDSGILVDSSVDLAQNLFRGGAINGRMATQRLVGYWFVRGGLMWRAPRQERRYDLSTGVDKAAGAPEPVPHFEAPSMTLAASASSERGDLAEATWDGRVGSIAAILKGDSTRLRCTEPLCTSGRISALVWRPGMRQLLITFTDRHRRQSLYLWDIGSNRLRLVVSSDGLLSGGRRNNIPCAVSASAAFCVAAAAGSPPMLERIDLDSGETRILFDPNAALRAAYTPAVEQLDWKTSDGTRIAGTLLTPTGTRLHSAPLFVNYYVCDGFLKGGEGDEWPIPALLDAGFAVACVNAAPFSGPQDGLATYRRGLDAVLALAALLEHRGLVDARRIAMGGFSFGSEVATWVATHSDLLAALSIASAQSDPAGYWFDSIGGGDRPRMIRKVWGLGRPEDTPARWALVSAALNAERISAPTLLQLPEQEARRIPEFYARLTQSRTPAELYAYPDEDHLKVQPRHRLAVYQRNLDWFRYWLQGYRDPDPSRANQYSRWDRLRERRKGLGEQIHHRQR